MLKHCWENCDKLEISSMILFDLSKTRITDRTLIIFYDLTDIFNKCERNCEKGNRSPCTKRRDSCLLRHFLFEVLPYVLYK